ncbi:hypothetical protein HCG49_10575, partial [Arenibacter sp. 6A1]|uniref:Ig-like domain-containing protein n=1 Tax=Arenibacter sp. 6A1 TaxID=2720391 RepID=UPI0016B1326E
MKTNYPLCFIYGVLYMLFLYSPTVFGKEFAISDHIGSITTINPENATCNQLEPLVNNAKFDHLTAETIPLGGLCIPIIGDVDKLVDTNLNSPTNLSLTGLGCEVELGVKDSDHSYPSGTFAGFKVSGAGLLQASIGASVEISTYRNGAFVEKKTVVSETIGLTTSLLDADGNIVLGFVTTKGFDEIRIKYESLLNVLFSAQVYHPVIKKFCEGPALNCNEPKALKAPDFPVVINNTNTGIEGVLCASCVVSDAENVISSNDFDFATIDLTVGVVAAGSIAVKDQLGSYPSGTFAGFDIGNTTLLGVELLNAITITTYEDGILKESKTGVDNLLSVNSFLLEGNGRQVVGFVSSDSFDEVKITIANTLAVNVGATKVFKAVVEKFCELGIGCNETYFLNDGVDGFPVVVSSEKTGTGGIACVGCSIDNTRYVISPNPQDYASLKMAVGVSGINSISVKNVLSNYPIGSVAGYAIEDLQGLLEVDLLNSLTVSTYLDGNYQESASGLDLLQLTVLVDIIGSSAGRYNIGFETSKPYNEIKISVSSLVSVENDLRVFGAFVDTSIANDPANGFDCLDTTAPSLDITLADTTLSIGDTTEVTFTFSEEIKEFDTTDITADNGTISNLVITADSTVWKATFTPNEDVESDTNTISVGTDYTDKMGNKGASADSPNYIIDTKAPTVPTVESQITNDTTPVLNGTAEVGTTIDVTVGGATYITTADGSGKWSINTETATPDSGVFNPDVNGENEVDVTSTDAAGNSTSDTTTLELTIDTTAPVVPTVESQITNDTTPVLNGTAEAGTTIDVTVGGATYVTTADGSGNWSINTETATPDSGAFNPDVNGENEVEVISTDAAGNSTSDNTTLELTIDTTAPVVPTVESQITNDTTPVLNGTAEAGTTVDVTVGGATYITTADGSGKWSINTETATPDSGVFNPNVNGENEVDVTSTDAAGNSTSDNTTLELTIDTTSPVVPTVESQITNDTTPVLNGTAEVGTTVDVTVGGATYITTADGSGNWSIDTETATPDSGAFNPDVNGENEIVVTSTDAAGNSTSDTTTLELTIDTTAPVVPTVESQITNDTTPVLIGTAEAGNTIDVTVGGATYITTADGSGNWIIDTETATPDSGVFNPNVNGENEVEVTSTDAAGNSTSDTTTLELTIDTTAPVVPTVESQITKNTTPVLKGTAEAGTTVNVTVGGATYITNTDGSGNWNIDTETATPDSGVFNPDVNGENEVEVTSTDAAGNSTSDNTTLELTIDTTAPVVPTVESQITNDTTPVLKGTAEVGTTVDVAVGGTTYITTADGSGNWSINTETATPDSGVFNPNVNGENEVEVISTDAAGNSTSDNTTLELTIDTTAPVVPTVESQITNDTTPVLNGTAEAGTTV